MSKKTQLVIFNAAFLQLSLQADYYASRESTQLASRWIAAVEYTINQILLMPQSHPCLSLGEQFPADLRRAVISGFPKHLLFYRYRPDDDVVRVVTILSGYMELEAALRQTAMTEQ